MKQPAAQSESSAAGESSGGVAGGSAECSATESPPSDIRARQPPSDHDRLWQGLALAFASAVGYTATNICLRAAAHLDPCLVSAMKALPTVVMSGAMLAWQGPGMLRRVPLGVAAWLVGVGLCAQVLGNVGFQWSLGVIGLAVTVPITTAGMIASGAVLGRLLLGEGVTPRSATAMTILVAAIVILQAGVSESPRTAAELETAAAGAGWRAAGAAGVASVAGAAYALLGVAIRRSVTGVAPIAYVLFVISVTGLVALGALAWLRIGWSGIAAPATAAWQAMIWAGVFNAVSFYAMSLALRRAPVIHVNAVSSSQSALAALAGVMIFAEPATGWLAAGVLLTTFGLLLMDRPVRRGGRA